MRVIGCAFVDTETGELQERRLQHPEEAERFLPRMGGSGNESACRNGSQWACALVRAIAGGAAVRVVDRRCG
jgi:hypothetical protein